MVVIHAQTPSRWIFNVEGKDVRGVWNPSQSFIPTPLISLHVAPGSGKPPINLSSRIFTYYSTKMMPLQIAMARKFSSTFCKTIEEELSRMINSKPRLGDNSSGLLQKTRVFPPQLRVRMKRLMSNILLIIMTS